MALQISPTKGNLISAQRSLKLAQSGYDLMDRKRNILMREMSSLIDKASEIQSKIDSTYSEAYLALQNATVILGLSNDLAETVPIENGLTVDYRSVMGVEIPIVKLDPIKIDNYFGFSETDSALDKAYIKFHEVKILTAQLAEIENSVYRLANAIRKTQKRSNALKNIIIPQFESNIKFIIDSLDEKEREEFSRLKLLKSKRK